MALIEGSGVRERDDWPLAFPEVFDEWALPRGLAV